MKKLLIIISLLVLANAAQAGSVWNIWTQTWDFNDGTQGWTKVSGDGFWVDPNVFPNGPTLPDGGVSGAGGGNLMSPDGTVWELSITPTNQWVLQADLYVPNLMPLNLNGSLPGNGIQGAGIGARNMYDKLIGAGGRGGADGIRVKDKTWDNSNRDRSWIMAEDGKAKEDPTYWDKWVTIQLQYNVNNDGKFRMFFYTPWDSPVHDGPGWYELGEWDIHPAGDDNNRWNTLRLGAVIPDTTPWTMTQIDNVKFWAVPEPGSVIALLSGMAGFASVAIRRKK